jgi:uncharacterized protein (TIGR03435 family)
MQHCHCQALANEPAFEVASITPCKPDTPAPDYEHSGMAHFTAPGGRFNARAATVKFLIEWAYDILPVQHSGGPSWMELDRYDIVAKAGRDATDDEMKLMTRTLLADRFKLKFQREMKEAPVLTLTPGKTPPKLYPPKPGEETSMRMLPQTGEGKKVMSYRIVATRFSFEMLNKAFARQIGYVIVNQSGVEGDFDFSFDLTPDDNRPNPLDPSILISALREQLGFTVKSGKAMVEFFVIDSVEKAAAN